MQLDGKVAVVTGAASGINRAIATRFAVEGARVVVADIDEPGGRDTARHITSAGGRAIAVRTDVRRRDDVEAMVRAAVAEFDHVDLLVNGAGIETLAPFLDLPDEEWNRVLSVNLTGSFVCGQTAAREMVRAGRGGKILNIASINAAVALPNQAHYVASKGGLLMLTKAMALELAPYGINVNAIGPGAVETPLTAGSLADPVRRELLTSHIPLGRVAQPDDIAGAAVFLCSEAANYITGTILYVDGGWLIS
jgi:NAD(P)-dependent dehydrogenase (short-subunit alcohol dehydrogenase family)